MSKHLQLPHVGMRKVKSLLAVFIGFWIWQAIRLAFPSLEVHPLYIYIYGMIEIRDSSKKTTTMGRDRIKTTFVAIGISLPFLFLFRWLTGLVDATWLKTGVELFLIILGILLTLIVAEKAGCHAYCGLCAAIFIIFMLTQKDGEPYLYSILRASQTILGVFVAWLVNVKLLPYDGKPKEEKPQEQKA